MASHPFDIGSTTSAGLHGRLDHESQANGSLMRISPLGVFGYSLGADQLAGMAGAESAVTHPHRVCREACGAFVVAIAHAVRTGETSEAVYGAALSWARAAGVDATVLRALESATSGPPASYSRQMGWVLIALQNAFYQALHAPSFEEGVVRTVMAGGGH